MTQPRGMQVTAGATCNYMYCASTVKVVAAALAVAVGSSSKCVWPGDGRGWGGRRCRRRTVVDPGDLELQILGGGGCRGGGSIKLAC